LKEELLDEMEQTEIIYRRNHLNKGKENILEMSLIYKNIYEYHQQIIYHPYLWSNDPNIPECGECDNCKRREADRAIWNDVKMEVFRLTKIVQKLVSRTKNPGSQFLHMTIYDIVDVFCDAKNTNMYDKDLTSIKEYGYNKNSKINTCVSCYYLLDMLILKGVIKQEIELKP